MFMGVHGCSWVCSWVFMGVHGCSCDIFVVLFKSIFFQGCSVFFLVRAIQPKKKKCLDQGYPAQENLYVK